MQSLLEIISPQCRILSESIDEATKERVMRVGVKWQHAGIINGNRRRYSKEILQREIIRLAPLIEQGKVHGSSFHPKDNGEVDDVSHIWESAKMESDGSCVGVVKVLPTSRGRNCQVLIKSGAWIGMSSRGRGTITQKEEVVDGKKVMVDEINPDYVLQSPGDFVLGPSVPDAGVQRMMESKFSDEKIREGIWWATSEGNKIDEEHRYELALKSGYRGSFKDFSEIPKSGADEEIISARFAVALAAGFRGTYPEFRKSYLGRKQ